MENLLILIRMRTVGKFPNAFIIYFLDRQGPWHWHVPVEPKLVLCPGPGLAIATAFWCAHSKIIPRSAHNSAAAAEQRVVHGTAPALTPLPRAESRYYSIFINRAI
jgi:hypothetical protein